MFSVGGAVGGRGGSSPFVVIEDDVKVDDDADDDPTLLCIDADLDDPSERAVSWFSQVRGGPDTWMRFWLRPTVAGRPT